MDEKIFDLKYYRYSKTVVYDIEQMIKRLDASMISIHPFTRYLCMKEIWLGMYETKKELEIQLKKYQEIKAKKGRVV